MTSVPGRPVPPVSMFDNPLGVFVPAPEVMDWVAAHILTKGGALFNSEHQHLKDAHLAFLWTSAPNTRQGRTVLGMAEMPMFRCGAWQRARQEQQLLEWFGDIPDFLVTLDACFCSGASDVEFAHLVEHELYHCAQAMDEFGNPKFNRDTGEPKFAMRGHDVEEFIGVVRRYGPVGQGVKDMVAAAQKPPEVAMIDIARACGTCMLKAV